MIGYITEEASEDFIDALDTLGIFSVKIYSQYMTYGAESRIVDFWEVLNEGKLVGAVSKLEGLLTIAAAPQADAEELAAFIQAVGAVAVEADFELIQSLSSKLDKPCESSWVMGFPQRFQHPVENSSEEIVQTSNFREVYHLLSKTDPHSFSTVAYDGWLCEMSHKYRHGLAEVFVLIKDKQICATASLLFESRERVIIAAIATEPSQRGCGYASRLTSYLVQRALEKGKTPYLFTREDTLERFYRRCGFVPAGRWGRILLR